VFRPGALTRYDILYHGVVIKSDHTRGSWASLAAFKTQFGPGDENHIGATPYQVREICEPAGVSPV
jgi:hypothetical protein